MVSFWDTLGIEPTTDQRKIKKAYASRLKRVHPEDDPEGCQELREAYETALFATEGGIDLVAPLERAFENTTAQGNGEEQAKEVKPPFESAESSAERFVPPPTPEQKREEQRRVADAVDALMGELEALGNRWKLAATWASFSPARAPVEPRRQGRLSKGPSGISWIGSA